MPARKAPRSGGAKSKALARTVERAYIPTSVRRDLWIAAAGRCEFRGCCKRVDRDFLTKAKCKVGEYAHIIADRKSTRLNSSHSDRSRMPSSA